MVRISHSTIAHGFNPKCEVADCDNPKYVKTFCKRHYHKVLRYGTPLGGRVTGRGERNRWINDVALRYDGEDCLDWPFSKSDKGYGVLCVPGWSGYASRFICEQAHGQPPQMNMHAAHSCGNGALGCVSPKHLRWASAKQNCADKLIHGTANIGVKHGNSKLTDENIRTIRSSRETQTSLSKHFGVNQATISSIILRKSWRHIT